MQTHGKAAWCASLHGQCSRRARAAAVDKDIAALEGAHRGVAAVATVATAQAGLGGGGGTLRTPTARGAPSPPPR